MSNNPMCEIIPGYLALTNIKTGDADYYKIEDTITTYLTEAGIQFDYDSDLCSFICKQLYDYDEERIDSVTIFWDDKTQGHVVEVRRLKGDAMFHCTLSNGFRKIYNELQNIFQEQNQEPQPQT
jgi:hypothetical protein